MTLWHGLYVVWLLAGTTDFLLHQRSKIEATSGLRESRLHLIQLFLLGIAVVAWLAFRPTPLLCVCLLVLVCLHAMVGYWDTHVAYPLRKIIPLEQHVHSILDIAPWIALGAVCLPLHQARKSGEWIQMEPASLGYWLFALIPALLLVVLPALLEYLRCLLWTRHKARARS